MESESGGNIRSSSLSWQVPTRFRTFAEGQDPDTKPFLIRSGFYISDKTVTIHVQGFPVECYHALHPPGWSRWPDINTRDPKPWTALQEGVERFKVVYQFGDEVTGNFSAGVEIILQ